MLPLITSRTNARVKILRAALEDHRKAPDGLVAIEGPNLIAEALRSGLTIDSVYLREGVVYEGEGDVPQHVLQRDVFDSVSGTDTSQGVAALVRSVRRGLPAKKDRLLLVAARLQDPGNLGTLIRSAEAFNADAVIVTPGTVDAWNQKAIRASAGSVFRIPVVAMELRAVCETGVRLIAAVAQGGSAPEECEFRGDCAILIGNEGAGLSEEEMTFAEARVTVPCPGAVESLNAAIAGSLLLYAASRQRQR